MTQQYCYELHKSPPDLQARLQKMADPGECVLGVMLMDNHGLMSWQVGMTSCLKNIGV
jgi:hypothetical protein